MTRSLHPASLTEKLCMIIEDDPHAIRADVAREALSHDDSILFFENLLQHGCVSGMVSSLIYYADTHSFFDRHYGEIEELRLTAENELGAAINPGDQDLKNFYAWFAFEQVALAVASELDLDL